ncbi:hypothetical protein HGO34_15495 [Agrobacterium vitis]|uniref:Uncharacterized protein n=1 Tax=Agrobacterium vitis TaxID=373 RepID=A0AAE5AWS8_AGRVI|nr:hypothetical protein [Agrobacterium vitis]MCF1498969.1 hypothetical protein [Allorhizobium sp. Av2]MCM2441125.1 hypothetical protein [Agrobacterium vitis]MUZ58417.1 hypothetical protein [Agrobacterium vitis]MVA65889.1 hypothetical protein [Agrobacterium vitis]MVA88089.1 hypothetical protein [Agrobacterium vitis]
MSIVERLMLDAVSPILASAGTSHSAMQPVTDQSIGIRERIAGAVPFVACAAAFLFVAAMIVGI